MKNVWTFETKILSLEFEFKFEVCDFPAIFSWFVNGILLLDGWMDSTILGGGQAWQGIISTHFLPKVLMR